MNMTRHTLIITGALFIFITSACNLPSTLTISPTETGTPASIPTQFDTPLSATPEFAPFCESGLATSVPVSPLCQLPIAKAGSAFCEKKNPYNLVYINQGATYEVLTRDFTCSEAGIKDGQQMLTCIGPMASDFAVSVCDPACAIPTIQTDVTQCPEGYNYNDTQGCCTQEPQQTNQNCVVLKLQSTSCVVDCSEFTKKATCNDNFYACEWDTASKVCRKRQ